MSHPPRNSADLLRLGSDPALCRLLRACGVEEAFVTGEASDYDKFLALAAALPLGEGHPLRGKVNATLTAATGLSAPLCPHTARLHWGAWVETHLYGGSMASVTAPAVCPHCVPPAPTVLHGKDLTQLPNPTEVQAPDLTAWSQALKKALPTDTSPALCVLSDDYAFTRPNPYHAGLAVGKVAQGEALTAQERDLLMTQALRVWGLALAGKEPNTAPLLLLRGGSPDAVTALLAYLAASKALPSTAWIPDDPAHAAAVSGLYATVRTGYAVRPDDPDGAKRAYAAVAPLGCGVALTER